jgi:methylated-DNA-[protein]-cysteine S-methyltransferase
MALVGMGQLLLRLTFGHASRQAAVQALDPDLVGPCVRGVWDERLMAWLRAFAAGEPVDFSGTRLDLSDMTQFRRRVVRCCRAIPYGETRTYGQLAAEAGSPGAARAVGSCMAGNPFPLVVPCHRVVAAGGRLGPFSAPGGMRTKQRLLAMEAAAAPA